MNEANPIALICLLLVILLIAIAVSGWLKRHWQLSMSAGFILVGFIIINGFALFKPVPVLDPIQLQQFASFILLPIILIDAAYRFNIRDLRHQSWRPILLLLPHFLVSLAFAILLLLWGLNYQAETSLLMVFAAALLILIADLSPPNQTLTMLSNLDESEPKTTSHTGLVQIESLVISVLALILFLGAASLSGLNTEAEFVWPNVTWYWLYWLWAILGGLVFGFVWGVIGGLITTNIHSHQINLLLLSTISWLSYLSSHHYFGVSGIMSVLSTVLIMNKAHIQFLTLREIRYMRALSRNLRYIAGVVIYGLIIYKLQISTLFDYWFEMLLAVVVFIMARGISLYGFFPLMAQLSGSQVSFVTRHVLFLSSNHSSLILLAVWLLPADIPAKDKYEAMAIALVLFSLFVQRPNLPPLFKNLSTKKPTRRINLIKS